jgi:hypothetical protein
VVGLSTTILILASTLLKGWAPGMDLQGTIDKRQEEIKSERETLDRFSGHGHPEFRVGGLRP